MQAVAGAVASEPRAMELPAMSPSMEAAPNEVPVGRVGVGSPPGPPSSRIPTRRPNRTIRSLRPKRSGPRRRSAATRRSSARAPAMAPSAASVFPTSGTATPSSRPTRPGNIVVTAAFLGVIDLGGGPLMDNGAEWALFVAKYDPQCRHVWSKVFGSPAARVEGGPIAIDAQGEIAIGRASSAASTSVTVGRRQCGAARQRVGSLS